ncbi:MAG: DUF4403 family protein [Bacteroidales bacterium]|nr:DUF4403 family protein [Bacteroidales bacterium]
MVSYQEFKYQPEPSLINVPIEMKIPELELFLNRQLTGLIYEDNSLDDNGGDNLMVKAWKKDAIKLSFDKGQFIYTVPLKLWIKAGWKIEKFGISLSDYKEVNAEISLDFHTGVGVNKDWSINTKTVSDGYRWISKPIMKLGPIDLPITFIADLIIKYNMGTISTAIDEGMKSSLDLKTNVQQAWIDIQKPMLLDKDYKLWLKVTPKSISAAPINGSKGFIRHTSSIQAVAECFTGKEPSYNVNKTLPDLTPVSKLSDNFIINLTSYIGYEYIDSISKALLVNTTYAVGKKNLTITGVNVYSGEDKLIVETDVTGSIKGKLYFAGKPVYRAADSSIILSNLDFHLKTRNVLLKSATWLANGGIERILEKKMVYPVGGDLRNTYDLLEENLKHYELAEGFYLGGQLLKMDVMQPVLSKQAIIAPVVIEGKVHVGLQNN